MNFTQQEVGEKCRSQLVIQVDLGLLDTIKVICRSVSRNDTGYEIRDQFGEFMGSRSLTYNRTGLNEALVDDLNILLDEFGVQINSEEFLEVFTPAFRKCESRYGYGQDGGDAIIYLE